MSAFALKIIAMVTMFIDHLFASCIDPYGVDVWNISRHIVPGTGTTLYWIGRMIGRIAFPIFCFQIVEGVRYTKNWKRYMARLALLALISEIPFDLMYGGTWFYPIHQNVIWTLLMGLLGIHLMETVHKNQKRWLYVLTAFVTVVFGMIFGTLCMVDYYGVGVLTVFVFYFFRGRRWWCLLGQFLALYWLNVELLGGLMYPVQIFGAEFEVCQQGLALLVLIPIWLYRGRQGYHSKPFQYICYAFYPVHMLVLVLVLNFVNR